MLTSEKAWLIREFWLGAKEIYLLIGDLARFVGGMTLLTIGLIFTPFTGGFSMVWAMGFCEWLDLKAPKPVRDLIYGYWAILGVRAVRYVMSLDF